MGNGSDKDGGRIEGCGKTEGVDIWMGCKAKRCINEGLM